MIVSIGRKAWVRYRRMNRCSALLDTCVLVPSRARDALLEIASTGAYHRRIPGLLAGVDVQRRCNNAEIWAAYFSSVLADVQIDVDDPREPDVRALLGRHLEFALAQTPHPHSFALDVDGLLDPAITLYSFRASGSLLGIGAIKRLDTYHAEIKSMHTAQAARGRGIGRAMLTRLLGVAQAQGSRRVSLETGTTAAFVPARALYQSAGFVECGPFASYQPSPHNLFMTLELDAIQAAHVSSIESNDEQLTA